MIVVIPGYLRQGISPGTAGAVATDCSITCTEGETTASCGTGNPYAGWLS